MSLTRQVVRNKIRNKYGNKNLKNIFSLYQKNNDKKKFIEKLDKQGKYKKPKTDKLDFAVTYVNKGDSHKKTMIVKATDKGAARQIVKDMFAVEKWVNKKKKRVEKVTVKGVKKYKIT